MKFKRLQLLKIREAAARTAWIILVVLNDIKITRHKTKFIPTRSSKPNTL